MCWDWTSNANSIRYLSTSNHFFIQHIVFSSNKVALVFLSTGKTWISEVHFFSLQYLKNIHKRTESLLEKFGLLFCIMIIWSFAVVLTVAGAYNNVSEKTMQHCRTDRSNLMSSAPWYRTTVRNTFFFILLNIKQALPFMHLFAIALFPGSKFHIHFSGVHPSSVQVMSLEWWVQHLFQLLRCSSLLLSLFSYCIANSILCHLFSVLSLSLFTAVNWGVLCCCKACRCHTPSSTRTYSKHRPAGLSTETSSAVVQMLLCFMDPCPIVIFSVSLYVLDEENPHVVFCKEKWDSRTLPNMGRKLMAVLNKDKIGTICSIYI